VSRPHLRTTAMMSVRRRGRLGCWGGAAGKVPTPGFHSWRVVKEPRPFQRSTKSRIRDLGSSSNLSPWPHPFLIFRVSGTAPQNLAALQTPQTGSAFPGDGRRVLCVCLRRFGSSCGVRIGRGIWIACKVVRLLRLKSAGGASRVRRKTHRVVSSDNGVAQRRCGWNLEPTWLPCW
jgi:hypothetical protein